MTTDTLNEAQPEAQNYQFEAEARQVLDLMIHSVYSHKDIFLRELISNASDALDKLRYEALTNQELAAHTSDLHIRLAADATARTLTISDNGIGMTAEELRRYLGTIARSGTKEFLTAARQAKAATDAGAAPSPELIGQFGVGFYSSFMVADEVEVISRKAGEAKATRWHSAGDGSYTLQEAERETNGTSITLHLKPADSDDHLEDYTKEWTLREVVRRYSDFVAYPIKMEIERTKHGEEGAPDEKTREDATLNSQQAIWTRPEKEVTDAEYNEFYRHISHDWTAPAKRILLKAEGTTEFRALLFLPSQRPFDLMQRDAKHGVQLYVRRVFIMANCEELLPEWLRFLRGVVDSEDLNLNISREILQKNRQLQTIRKAIVKKVLDTLRVMQRDEPEQFASFWQNFGAVLKAGVFQDREYQEQLLEICRFASTQDDAEAAAAEAKAANAAGENDGDAADEDEGEVAPKAHRDGLVTLRDYIDRMKPEQENIYFITAPSRATALGSPHLEAYRAKGYEVLLLTDPVDELWSESFGLKFDEKSFVNITKSAAELGTEEERKAEQEKLDAKKGELGGLLQSLGSALGERVKEVRLSTRLTDSPACLVGERNDMTPHLEALLRANGQEVPTTKRILELNAEHPVVRKLQALHGQEGDAAAQAKLADYGELLYGQALLAEGSALPDAAAFSRRVTALMTEAI